MEKSNLNDIIFNNKLISPYFKNIASKVLNNKRISIDEGLILYEKAELGFLASLADHIKKIKHGENIYYKKNFHIEPTNICIYKCKFCSYARKIGEEGSWELSLLEIEKQLEKYKNKNIFEIHITGGVHPERGFDYYCSLLKLIRKILPNINIKAFSAIELEYIIKQANISYEEGLQILKKCGLNSIPGGGAEIFDNDIRKKICPEKTSSEDWLKIHETAHKLGISSNATMLYGHIENYSHRINHLNEIRNLQDKAMGFSTFIPLKFRKENNNLSYIYEVSTIEDLKNYAISRIFLDNIPHIKAYWPMIGIDIAQISLNFGVDDIDGTIDDSTKIYTMAGVNITNRITSNKMKGIIKKANHKPFEII